MPRSVKQTVRSVPQALVIMCFGVGGGISVVANGLSATRPGEHALTTSERAAFVFVGLMLFGFLTRLASCRAQIRPDALNVRNPLYSASIPWGEIESFRIGRHGIWPQIAVVTRTDGSQLSIWAIQGRGPAYRRTRNKHSRALLGKLEAARQEYAEGS